MYADFYRDTAKGIEEEMKGKNIYTAGHWGWQWYSKKNGMKLYNTDSLSIKDSDYLVYPADVSHQEFNSRLKMEVVKRIWKEPSYFTFFSVSTFASMYNSFMDKTPWCFSKNPTDTLIVTQVRWLPDSTGKGN